MKTKLWGAKALGIQALAGLLDMGVGTLLAVAFHLPTRVCTTIGLIFGCTINFLAQRKFAFADRDTRLAQSTGKWLVVTAGQILLHGQLVTMLRDWAGVPYVPAKMAGDFIVFTGLQLLLMRYVIFPERKAPVGTVTQSAPAPTPPARDVRVVQGPPLPH